MRPDRGPASQTEQTEHIYTVNDQGWSCTCGRVEARGLLSVPGMRRIALLHAPATRGAVTSP